MKKLTTIILSLVLTIPFAVATTSSTLDNVWRSITGIGNLGFLGMSDGSIVVGFTRILIWIAIFTLFFAVITGLGGKGKGKAPMSFFSRAQAGVIAAVFATLAAVFLPGSVLLATGAGWATAIALLLIGLPVVGIAFLLWQIPWDGQETKFTVLLKLILVLILFWILTAMKYHVGRMGVL